MIIVKINFLVPDTKNAAPVRLNRKTSPVSLHALSQRFHSYDKKHSSSMFELQNMLVRL